MYDSNIKYILASYVCAGFIDSNLVFGLGSTTTVIPKEYKDIHSVLLKSAALLIKTPLTLSELYKILHNNYSFSKEICKNTIDYLLGCNFIIPLTLKIDKNYRYSRYSNYYIMNSADPNYVQNNLFKSHVCFIGCGGIGSLMSVVLAASGVKNLTLIDDDIIEESNLTRQIVFSESDIGKNKVNVLKEQIKQKNSSVSVKALIDKIDTIDKFKLIPKCNLVIISGDDHKDTLKLLKKYLYSNMQPYMEVGYSIDYPTWSLISDFSKKNKEISIEKSEFSEEIKLIDKNLSPPSVAHINLISIGFAVQDAISYLGKFSEPKAKEKTIHLMIDKLKFVDQNINIEMI